jgi:hypothetical protein
MKTIKQTSGNLARYLTALVIAGLMSLPTFAFAQEKGAAKLVQLKPIETVADAEAVKPGDMVVMSCPKCKDSWVTIVEKPTKTGASANSAVMARHECPGCEHKYVSEGHGKAKTDKLVHVCKKCGSEDAFCCVMKKVTGPTPGMEKR